MDKETFFHAAFCVAILALSQLLDESLYPDMSPQEITLVA